MGRAGKVELKRIENKIRRQITFSKRRSGLQKKAREISLLCDAEVAMIVFSNKGNLFHFSSPDSTSMKRIIERYEQRMIPDKKLNTDRHSVEIQCLEYPKLKCHAQLLQRTLRNYEGLDLDPLGLKELWNLEQQLDASLRRIQTRKNQLMHETICDLQRKERALQDQNKALSNKKQLENKEQVEEDLNVHILQEQHPSTDICIPSLTIGFSSGGGSQKDGSQPRQTESGALIIPPWLVSHLNSQHK